MPAQPVSDLQDLVGASRETVEAFSVEAGKVEEFARATHNEDPIHRDEAAARAAGYDRIPAPATFLIGKQFPRYQPDDHPEEVPFDLGFDMGQVLHGEQEFRFHRPLFVGDVLTGDTTLTDVYQREGEDGPMTFAVLETTVSDRDGNPIATDRITIIERTFGTED